MTYFEKESRELVSLNYAEPLQFAAVVGRGPTRSGTPATSRS